MSLTPADRNLLQRCLNRQPGAWNEFVDRFLNLIYHTIHHTAYLRSVKLRPEDIEDVAAEILYQLVANDFAVLQQFKGNCSLASYLTVIARRNCVHELARRSKAKESQAPKAKEITEPEAEDARPGLGLESLEEVQKLLKRLRKGERKVVQLYYLEGRSYEEISTALGIPVNSIGPILSRARKKLQQPSSGDSKNTDSKEPKKKEKT